MAWLWQNFWQQQCHFPLIMSKEKLRKRFGFCVCASGWWHIHAQHVFMFSVRHFIASSGGLNHYDSNCYVDRTSKSGDIRIFLKMGIWKYLGRVSILLCHYIYSWSFSIRNSEWLALNRRRTGNSVLKKSPSMCNDFLIYVDLLYISFLKRIRRDFAPSSAPSLTPVLCCLCAF